MVLFRKLRLSILIIGLLLCILHIFQKRWRNKSAENVKDIIFMENTKYLLSFRLNAFWQKMIPPPPDQTCASVEAYSFILRFNIWYLGQKLWQRVEPSTSLQRLPKDQRKAHPKQELFGWTMLCHRTPNMSQTAMQSQIQLNLNHQNIAHQVSAPFHILSNDSLNL